MGRCASRFVMCPGCFISIAAMTFSSAPRRSRSGPKIASRSSWSRLFDLSKSMKKSRVPKSSSTRRRKDPCRPVTKLTASAGTSMMVRSSCFSGSSKRTGPTRCAKTSLTYFFALSRSSCVPTMSRQLAFNSRRAPLTAAIFLLVLPLGPMRKRASSSVIATVSMLWSGDIAGGHPPGLLESRPPPAWWPLPLPPFPDSKPLPRPLPLPRFPPPGSG
mmetsp:Transcript_6128/g.18987  ORF Transcript_6128/g.18987 Transcript_6128/m.18987 type:complete len:217 (-) Transcript_6128:692-1342(-)